MSKLQRCLFLDRDGIINKDIGYAYKPSDIEFMPGIFQLCETFNQRGYIIIIVTNQSGIARGYYSEDDFQALNRWIEKEFLQRGIHISATYHCPHHPEISGPCDCRKPQAGMLLSAIKHYKIDPQSSIMIGDKLSDMQAAETAKIGTKLWLCDNSNDIAQSPADIQASDLRQALALLTQTNQSST